MVALLISLAFADHPTDSLAQSTSFNEEGLQVIIGGTITGPLTGEITETNQIVVDDPAAVNKDPEGESWFFKIKIKNKSELDELMNKADYEKFAKENSN